MIANRLKFSFYLLIFVLLTLTLHATEEYKEYVYEIEHTFAEQMYEEFGLHLSGNMHVVRDKVEELGLSFLTYRRATLEEARNLELLVIERFVQAINSHKKIQSHLDIHPFSFKRATISINFEGPNRRISDESISYIFNVSDLATTPSKNHIVYFSHDPFKDTLDVKLREPYEEAVRLNALSNIDPAIHKGNEYETEMDALLASFVRNVEEQYGVEGWSIGGKLLNGIEEIGAKFRVLQSVTQNEARQLLIEMTQKLLLAVNRNEKLRPFLKQSPFPSNFLKIRLFFEDKKGSFPPVSMESIVLEDDIITYVQKVTQPLREGYFFKESENVVLGKESYQEALQITQQNPQKFKPQTTSFFTRLNDWLAQCMRYFYFALTS